jgi:anthranilate synthase component II
MILVLDNFDSFTYNLVQLLAVEDPEVLVRRNNAVTVGEVCDLRPDALLISPGPGRPESAGITMDLIARCAGTIPMLGICLGHQAIGCVFGARLVHAPAPVHGKLSAISHDGAGIFAGLPDPFQATRYHSLTLDAASMPADLEITARSGDGVVMGIRHRTLPLAGVQFHPESALCEHGAAVIHNWYMMQKCP